MHYKRLIFFVLKTFTFSLFAVCLIIRRIKIDVTQENKRKEMLWRRLERECKWGAGIRARSRRVIASYLSWQHCTQTNLQWIINSPAVKRVLSLWWNGHKQHLTHLIWRTHSTFHSASVVSVKKEFIIWRRIRWFIWSIYLWAPVWNIWKREMERMVQLLDVLQVRSLSRHHINQVTLSTNSGHRFRKMTSDCFHHY